MLFVNYKNILLLFLEIEVFQFFHCPWRLKVTSN